MEISEEKIKSIFYNAVKQVYTCDMDARVMRQQFEGNNECNMFLQPWCPSYNLCSLEEVCGKFVQYFTQKNCGTKKSEHYADDIISKLSDAIKQVEKA